MGITKVQRKHWLEYPSGEIIYGQHEHGFGCYHTSGLDYWLDWESATPYEVEKYKKYLKSKGFKEKRGTI